MEIDHVAIVVQDLEATLRFYTQTLGFTELYREV
ncbi:MAG: VOC family protein, partial [Candidatus Eremiobacteraeota bacterium]|nr:VOC family protein [Candidatus Eremiobacteraeota bacterium]